MMKRLLGRLWSRFVALGDWLTRQDELFRCNHAWRTDRFSIEEIGERGTYRFTYHCAKCGATVHEERP